MALVSAAILALLRATPAGWTAGGSLLGLASLFRPENQMVLALAGSAVGLQQRSLRHATLVLLGGVAVLAPWSARNRLRLGFWSLNDPLLTCSSFPQATSLSHADPVAQAVWPLRRGGVTAAERRTYRDLATGAFIER